jgi:tetratricopeptide (TPR) repeat protein
LLACWLQISYNAPAVAKLLEGLPPYIMASDPEVRALLITSTGPDKADLAQVISWSGCKRAQAMLFAARSYANSGGAADVIEPAMQALNERADSLAARWPAADLESPAQIGKPKWHWTLTRIASKRLAAGDFESAVAVYEDVVYEDPLDPESVNNLGFCRMPIDIQVALRELEAARGLFGRPFAVNSANRMLAHFRLQQYDEVLMLGEEFAEMGGTRTSAWLWDIDTPALLCDGVDVMGYIVDICERAAQLSGRFHEANLWASRRALWMSGDMKSGES